MEKHYETKAFKSWLDKLQQESWQLELLISGFAIFGLVSLMEVIDIKRAEAYLANMPGLGRLLQTLMACSFFFVFNLLLHVLLRGLWIGAIGLRYVSGEIDFEKLNYSEKFSIYLKRKIGSFDRYISQLEDYCSILFSLTFLLVFYFIGFSVISALLGFIVSFISELEFISDATEDIITKSIYILFGITAFIVFIDFLGQGFLKKRKWTSKLYFPIYWVYSKLTLSFLYRPIAYNFLDNKLGKRISLFLVPVYTIIATLSSLYYVNSNYLYSLFESSPSYAHNLNYEDEITEPTEFVGFASIPSKVIREPFLKVFIPYTEIKETFVFAINNSLEPEEDDKGFKSNIVVINSNDTVDYVKKEAKLAEYLKSINTLYTLKIDSTILTSDFIITKNAKKRKGFETYLDIEYLKKGKHLLVITGPTQFNNTDTITFDHKLLTIPFWYFPENHSSVTSSTENLSTLNNL
ncbi:hypothetical protein [Maribacter sp. IgM3_T14_3]|uniref:hypothetical protein n=1 Tax=Maribacter sp. IgM3_T14_3 TaxID=3415140 RepID=UPI003C6F6538